MERDEYRQKAGDMHRDLEEKEGSPSSFDVARPARPKLDGDDPHAEGTMGDSRPDRIDPSEAHFVDGEDDPNAHLTRRTTELTEPEREGAEELAEIRHDDSSIKAKPMGPFLEEGAYLAGREPDGEDS